jgi:hypothetical protein
MRRTTTNLTEAQDAQIKYLQGCGYGDFTQIIRTALDRMYMQERASVVVGRDMVCCDTCGAEYDRLRYPHGHPCDPADLRQIERDRQTDAEVRRREAQQ